MLLIRECSSGACFEKPCSVCGAGNYRHQRRISPRPAALLIAAAGRWRRLRRWVRSTGCRLPSSSSSSQTRFPGRTSPALPRRSPGVSVAAVCDCLGRAQRRSFLVAWLSNCSRVCLIEATSPARASPPEKSFVGVLTCWCSRASHSPAQQAARGRSAALLTFCLYVDACHPWPRVPLLPALLLEVVVQNL